MAEACRGASFWQLARVVDWHVREETYVQATGRRPTRPADRLAPARASWPGPLARMDDPACRRIMG